MDADLSEFVFTDDPVLDNQRDFNAHVSSGITDRNQLFEVLKRELRLPDYFGANWDGLADCLRDLSWVQQKRIVIIHEDVPSLEPTAQRSYFEVLAECVRDWKPDDQHELVVTFPKVAYESIKQSLKQTKVL